MQYQIQGQPYPVVILTVEQEETVCCQKGAMAWMTPNMEMQTKGGGIGKMFSRALTGESMFQNEYTAKGGPGMIAFASALPGEIMPIQVTPDKPIVAQKSAFLASERGVSFELFFQKRLAGGFFGGEGFLMQKFSGNGMLFLEIDGSMVAYDLAPGQSMMVDTGNLAAMESTCTLDVQTVKGVGNVLLGGEGLFNTKVTGPGRIWLQTLPLSNMASALAKVMPSSK
ncbi:TIGR00266 family protein [uncultured Ruminococcus sp.]|uniref:TIGR00266 family protein n=1 Tax=uncultured Ruminococcus sp. TaxID=165186 RepID=UPI0025CCD8D4|nr:TIGR00266 family protein [uncultured Ruminococcus sp.]